MSRRKSNSKKFYTGVAFDPEIIAYLDELSRKIGTTRSLALNFILREPFSFPALPNVPGGARTCNLRLRRRTAEYDVASQKPRKKLDLESL
jgi:hypothetical protein